MRLMRLGVLALAGAVLLAGCRASYPKEGLTGSVRDLFLKELGVDVQTRLVGKTLYVAFKIDNIVTKNFELPEEATVKLENAMLSISRIALSTDAKVEYTVIEMADRSWGVKTTLVRRMQDLKDLFYWRISKPDFDERLVLEIENPVANETADVRHSTGSAGEDFRVDLSEWAQKWHDISLEEFSARWVASRINLGARSNPFLGVLLGIKSIRPVRRAGSETLDMIVEDYTPSKSTATVSVSVKLLKSTLSEQLAGAEKKYWTPEEKSAAAPPVWVREVVVKDLHGNTILKMPREEWVLNQKK